MKLQKWQFKGETHQFVECINLPIGFEFLRMHNLILTTLTHAVVTCIQVERWFWVFDDVFINLYACLKMVQFIFTLVEFKYFGRDAFVCSQKEQFNFCLHFSDNFVYHCHLWLFQKSSLQSSDSISLYNYPWNFYIIILLLFMNSFRKYTLEINFTVLCLP